MAMKTLDEINREFLIERLSYNGSNIPARLHSESLPATGSPLFDKTRPAITKPKIKRAKIQFRLPRLQLRLPRLQLKLPRIQFRLPRLQLKLPRLQFRLPRIQFRLPRIQFKLPRIQPKLPALPQIFPAKKKSGLAAFIADALFYLTILMILISVIFSNSGGSEPKVVMGYSYFTALTSTMQAEIPKGALILVQKTAEQNLQIGDNITYMREANVPVTHKIVDILENYQDSGARAFETQGLNVNSDKEIVYAESVVGKVNAVLPLAGAAMLYIITHIHLAFIILGLLVILTLYARGLLFRSLTYRTAKELSGIHKTAAS